MKKEAGIRKGRIFNAPFSVQGKAALLVLLVVFPIFSSTFILEEQKSFAASAPMRLMVLASPSDPVIGPILQSFMKYPTDMDWGHARYFPTLTAVTGGTSLSLVRNAAENAPSSQAKVIAYDFEHWSLTPVTEQSDPVNSANKAASLVHSLGLKFMFVPDGGYMYDLHNGVPFYKLYNWTNFDYLNLQVQTHRFAGGGDGTNVASFVANVQNVVSYAKSQHPGIIVFVQLSLRYDSPLTIIQKTQAISNISDGITYHYNIDHMLCANCTPSNLQTVLHSLRPNF